MKQKKLSRVERWLAQGTMAAPGHRSHVAGWKRMSRNADAHDFLERDEKRLASKYANGRRA